MKILTPFDPLGRRARRFARLQRIAASVPLLLVACGASGETSIEASAIPVPSWVEDPEVVEFPDGQVQVSFAVDLQYPDRQIRDFYGQWAAEHGWSKVAQDVDPWSVDRWESFEDMYGTTIDQWLVHWRSPDGSESLRLALRHTGDRTQQEVFVIRSPFDTLTQEQQQDTGQDLSQDPPCPDGELAEPVAQYQPLPPTGLLQDQCSDALNNPNLFLSIDSAGRVESIDLLLGTGCAYADEELRRCISEWVFTPASCDGKPVAVQRGLSVAWEDTSARPSDSDPCLPFDEARTAPRE